MKSAQRVSFATVPVLALMLSGCATQGQTNMLEGCAAGALLTGLPTLLLDQSAGNGVAAAGAAVAGCAAGTAVALVVNGQQQKYASLDDALTAQISIANQDAQAANQATADAQTKIDNINQQMAALGQERISLRHRNAELEASYQQLAAEQQTLAAEQSSLTSQISEQQQNYASVSKSSAPNAAQAAQIAQWQTDITNMQNALSVIVAKQSQTAALMANIRAADRTVG